MDIGKDQAQRDIERMANEEESSNEKYLADVAVEGKMITENFIKEYGQKAYDELEYDEDIFESMEAVRSCDHMCSGNCRRDGCNCACGEWHILPLKEYK